MSQSLAERSSLRPAAEGDRIQQQHGWHAALPQQRQQGFQPIPAGIGCDQDQAGISGRAGGDQPDQVDQWIWSGLQARQGLQDIQSLPVPLARRMPDQLLAVGCQSNRRALAQTPVGQRGRQDDAVLQR